MTESISVRQKFIYSPIFETKEQCESEPFKFHASGVAGRTPSDYEKPLKKGFLLNWQRNMDGQTVDEIMEVRPYLNHDTVNVAYGSIY